MSFRTEFKDVLVGDFVNRGEAEIKTGPFGTQLHASDYVATGTPVINVRNIGFGTIRPEKLEYISEETVSRLASHLLKPGDIVFGRKGAVERHAFIQAAQERWFQGSDCIRVRFKSQAIDVRFVSYSLLLEPHKQWIMNQSSHGATMASLNQEIISRIPLKLPPLETQQKIAAILSSYDDLIENNTRRIEILEDMARGLYREWFVNFRFPGHEEVEMVDSSLGQIPAGWQAKLEDCLTLQRGFDLPNSQRKAGSVPIYASTGITATHDEAKVRGPGVVTGRSGSLGTVVYVQEDYWPLNTALWVKAFKRSTPLHSFFLLSNMGLEQYNSGAAVPTLNRNDVHGLPVAVPPRELLMQFDQKVDPMYLAIRNLTRRNANLRRTRDLLLPKLISGEIDVSTLEVAGVTGLETASESV